MTALELIGSAVTYGVITIFDAVSAEIRGSMLLRWRVRVQMQLSDTVAVRGNARNNTYGLQ
jgi:shikimate kinase